MLLHRTPTKQSHERTDSTKARKKDPSSSAAIIRKTFYISYKELSELSDSHLILPLLASATLQEVRITKPGGEPYKDLSAGKGTFFLHFSHLPPDLSFYFRSVIRPPSCLDSFSLLFFSL